MTKSDALFYEEKQHRVENIFLSVPINEDPLRVGLLFSAARRKVATAP